MSSRWQIPFSAVYFVYLLPLLFDSTPFVDELGIWSVPLDNHRLAEMEFYLVDELECNLIVFHPYRTLTTLCTKESKDVDMVLAESAGTNAIGEPGGSGVDGGERYWGTDVGKLILDEKLLQLAWSVGSLDCRRSSLTLLTLQDDHQRYVPHGCLSFIPSPCDCHCRHLSFARQQRANQRAIAAP